jgi:hypothetical protein
MHGDCDVDSRWPYKAFSQLQLHAESFLLKGDPHRVCAVQIFLNYLDLLSEDKLQCTIN